MIICLYICEYIIYVYTCIHLNIGVCVPVYIIVEFVQIRVFLTAND